MNIKKTYETGSVPRFKSTTYTSPGKLFFYMPQDIKIRKLWFKILLRMATPTNSYFYCCEDDFNVSITFEIIFY